MTDHTPPTDAQLDDIAARAASLHEYATLDDAPFQADADQLTGTDVPALLAEVRRQRTELAELRGELERPAVELKRNEIRLSYRQLAVQAREDRDYEGEATVLKQLADHEEQWKREDAAVPDAPSGTVGVAVNAPQPDSGHRAHPDTPGAPQSHTGAPAGTGGGQ